MRESVLKGRDGIRVRHYLNEFSDRWPDTCHEYYCLLKMNPKWFQITILGKLIAWGKLPKDEVEEVELLIKKLEFENYERPAKPIRKPAPVKQKIEIEEVSNGKL